MGGGGDWNPNKSYIHVDLAHVGEYDAALLGQLLNRPSEALPVLEMAAADALRTLLYAQQLFGGNSIQIMLRGNLTPTPLRSIQSHHMNSLLKCPGIIISCARVRPRAMALRIRCTKCMDVRTVFGNSSVSGTNGGVGSRALGLGSSSPFAGFSLPTRCLGPNPQECGPSPYAVLPDDCLFVDQQTLKLQEAPEMVPTGEMPRSVLVAVERGLVDKAPPGTRVTVLAIASLFNTGGAEGGSGGVKTTYLRVVGMERESSTADSARFSPAEEEAFRQLSRRPDIYNILYRSIAPSISGSYTVDLKKAILCLLFGGSRKRLPDGMKLRGDINVLLLGDPSTAKSQFLKFATRVAPVGVYTSGKGSSAAGLTASVVRDARGEFYLEGGAMVLADGGIVAIDEFDKMRPADRVAIHEAMEQQTISIAKAGITTVLNSRSSVLAAANPVFGRYDDLKSASENIDLMSTILSRFDLIFLVRDVRDETRDRMICRHVMGVHIGNSGGEGDGAGELDVPTMKKYIQYCKAKCAPRLSDEAGDILASSYVKIRDDVRKRTMDSGQAQAAIPITVRQLEALVRVSESLAKMRLDSQVQSEDIAEALRLFKVSTMTANSTDQTNAMPSQEELMRAETFLRSRLAIGAVLNKQRIVEEAAAQGYNAMTIARAMSIMVARGEVQERNQSRMVKRVR
ncbi:mcm5-like protein [Thalassiosira pseudonana CCMP1335]|uniref:DNA replication licensing factor MCM5 n=1 Tax=Thalassiosira pseudonana TaxID=35128 RepID=B8BRW4_THAPS|nr:mcm5-like protein [Thalassiosira pseudonana CCMP1335]EED96028.1 mcm5-like protein [Thalassiosira pseudonana CCMP1335]